MRPGDYIAVASLGGEIVTVTPQLNSATCFQRTFQVSGEDDYDADTWAAADIPLVAARISQGTPYHVRNDS